MPKSKEVKTVSLPWVLLVWFDDKYRESKRFDNFDEAVEYANSNFTTDAVAFRRDHSNNPLFEKGE